MVHLRYHQNLFDLCQITPEFSSQLVEEISTKEHQLGFELPRSLKEFYSLNHSKIIINRYIVNDRMFWIKDFRPPVDHFLVVMQEAESVYIWAVELTGEQDPPVRVKVKQRNTYSDWLPYTKSFSEFLLGRVLEFINFDYPGIDSYFVFQTVSEGELGSIQKLLQPMVVSTNAPDG